MKKMLYWIIPVCLLVVMILPGSAQAADIGLEKHTGENFDIYVPAGDQLDYAGLIIFVNYGDHELTLKVYGHEKIQGNKTYHIQVIAPHSSELIEVYFVDVETTYWISVMDDTRTLLTITKYRGSYYLPPPKDTWRILPPDKEPEEKKYTEFDLLRALSQLKLETIVIATIVALIGATMGAGIKTASKFLVPWDLFSLTFYGVLLIDTVFDLSPVEKIWYAPLLVGYWIGFILWHIDYIIPIKIDSESKTLRGDPIVVYNTEESQKLCIQEQSNRALIRRLLGVHHELGTDAGINPDWHISVKKPYWPRIKAPALWVQKSRLEVQEVSKGRWKLLKKRTQLALANASKMPYYLWLITSKAFYDLTERLEWSENQRIMERLMRHAETTAAAADMLTHSLEVSTHEAIAQLFPFRKEKEEIPTLDEHMTVFEEIATRPKEEEEDELEESDEESEVGSEQTDEKTGVKKKSKKGKK